MHLLTSLLVSLVVPSSVVDVSQPGVYWMGVNRYERIAGFTVSPTTSLEAPAYWSSPTASVYYLPMPTGAIHGRAIGVGDNNRIWGTVYYDTSTTPVPPTYVVYWESSESYSVCHTIGSTPPPTLSNNYTGEAVGCAWSGNGVTGSVFQLNSSGYPYSETYRNTGFFNAQPTFLPYNVSQHLYFDSSHTTMVGERPDFGMDINGRNQICGYCQDMVSVNDRGFYRRNGDDNGSGTVIPLNDPAVINCRALATSNGDATDAQTWVTGFLGSDYFVWQPPSTFRTVDLPSTGASVGMEVSRTGDVGGQYGTSNLAFLSKHMDDGNWHFNDLNTLAPPPSNVTYADVRGISLNSGTVPTTLNGSTRYIVGWARATDAFGQPYNTSYCIQLQI